jgi:metallophosphoesterase (TIGR03767 family)
MTTDANALVPGLPGAGGYRTLSVGPGEPHVVRRDLLDVDPAAGDVLATIAHLSDLHVCDAQSPARAELLDRWADPDSAIVDDLGEVGTYRAHEMLTAQVVEACVRAVNATPAGPTAEKPIDFAVSTGDNTDNAQLNELEWYLRLLEGGLVRPDSGDLNRYEGVADDTDDDERFWHPSSTTDDLPRSRYGFPAVPGLLDAARRVFEATGLTVPWYAVHGNHDRLIQGTVPGAGLDAVIGDQKPIALPADWTPERVREVIIGLNDCDPSALAAVSRATMRTITPDTRRRITTKDEFVRAHFSERSRPTGHGFTREDGPTYYRADVREVSLLVLDTVDEYGGWEGSLDRGQFEWLDAELSAADVDRRYVVLASHHPLERLVNATGPDRILAADVEALLTDHPSVILWLAGHTHQTAVVARGSYWQVVAPSLIDWPQQARIVELIRTEGAIAIVATMLDHTGTAPWDGRTDSIESLAGLSRELAANDWQWRALPLESHPRAGGADERNVTLMLPDPWAH